MFLTWNTTQFTRTFDKKHQNNMNITTKTYKTSISNLPRMLLIRHSNENVIKQFLVKRVILRFLHHPITLL